jgi:hypothetical protein
LAYADDVVAHHEPESRPRGWRGTRELRNEIWSTWLRRPLPRALRLTGAVTAQAGGMRALIAALRGAPWVLRERRVVPPHVEHSLRLLEQAREDGAHPVGAPQPAQLELGASLVS